MSASAETIKELKPMQEAWEKSQSFIKKYKEREQNEFINCL